MKKGTHKHTAGQHAALLRMNAAKRKYPREHGIRTRIYHIWRRMKTCCSNRNDPRYPRYGGRGILICPEWSESYGAFREWALTHGYQEHLTLDRTDNNAGYYPANCRWVTYQENNSNRRDTVLVTAWGETRCMAAWATDHRCSITLSSLHKRLRLGIPPELAISLPAQRGNGNLRRKAEIPG